jgi:hypothetical protein
MSVINRMRCRLLDEVSCSMEKITLSGSQPHSERVRWPNLSRLVHLNRNERVLRDIKAQLDDAYRDFVVCLPFSWPRVLIGL